MRTIYYKSFRIKPKPLTADKYICDVFIYFLSVVINFHVNAQMERQLGRAGRRQNPKSNHLKHIFCHINFTAVFSLSSRQRRRFGLRKMPESLIIIIIILHHHISGVAFLEKHFSIFFLLPHAREKSSFNSFSFGVRGKIDTQHLLTMLKTNQLSEVSSFQLIWQCGATY